jgi:hypothetical protein
MLRTRPETVGLEDETDERRDAVAEDRHDSTWPAEHGSYKHCSAG